MISVDPVQTTSLCGTLACAALVRNSVQRVTWPAWAITNVHHPRQPARSAPADSTTSVAILLVLCQTRKCLQIKEATVWSSSSPNSTSGMLVSFMRMGLWSVTVHRLLATSLDPRVRQIKQLCIANVSNVQLFTT